MPYERLYGTKSVVNLHSRFGFLRKIGDKGRKIKQTFSREPWWAELWSSVAAFGWALYSYLYNIEFFFTPNFFYLGVFAQKEFWEMSGAIVGVVQAASLFSNKPVCRWLSAFFASWWWSFITICIYQDASLTPSIALYSVFSLINLVSMIRLAKAIK